MAEQEKKYAKDTILREMAKDVETPKGELIVAAITDGEVRGLSEPVGEYRSLSWVFVGDTIGQRVYRRSVLFLLVVAIRELYGAKESELIVRDSANNGLYCDIVLPCGVTDESVAAIEAKMREIVREDRPIERRPVPREEAVHLFKEVRQIPKANVIAAMKKETVDLWFCGQQYDDFYGVLVDRTGVLDCFTLERMDRGVLFRTPSGGGLMLPQVIFQPKFSQTLKDSVSWAKILHCEFLPDLNRIIQHGETGNLIRISEALHEKKIAEIADRIASNIGKARLVMIAGPSSSGKTSFAQRLKVQLRVNGLEPVSISMDDYFLDREKTPRTPAGAYDFESLHALHVELFNEHLVALMAGKEVALPHYDFVTGYRTDGAGEKLCITPEQPIIVEGIHGLNEALTHAVPRDQKFKIYISALTQLDLDMHNRIPTTEARLIRRLVRDYQFRASSAIKTLRQWPDVRHGEDQNIFPFQEEGDAIFNSALIYELAVLRKYAMPLLEAVPPEVTEYVHAQSLMRLLANFEDIREEDDIPNNSILREFIGKSCFFTPTGELKA